MRSRCIILEPLHYPGATPPYPPRRRSRKLDSHKSKNRINPRSSLSTKTRNRRLYQEQTTVQSSSQATTITSQRPGSSYVGGGSSNATDTRVRAISGGWLTGSAGIRWDVTDRESRTLRIADEMEDRGQISSADRMRCSIRGIWKVVGGTSDACWTELSGSRTKIDRTSHNREYDVAIQDLQRQLELLQEDVERDDEACERRWESCVGK